MSFTDELNRRLRVVAGAPADAEVSIENESRMGGYCETCEYTETYVVIRWTEEAPGSRYGVVVKEKEFSDLGSIMRQVDAVPDLEES